MKKIIAFFVIFAVVAAIGAKPFLGLAQPAEIPLPRARIAHLEGDVKIKAVDKEWEAAMEYMELEKGDSLKTGADGYAVLNFFDSSSARIASNSEISFEKLAIDPDDHAKNNVGINVSVGRVWSRIIKLMDKESSYEVGTSDTVATVRGTAFDFAVTDKGAEVAVADSKVSVAYFVSEEKKDETSGAMVKMKRIVKSVDLKKGEQASLPKSSGNVDKAEIKVQKIVETESKSAWYLENQKADQAFLEQIQTKKEDASRRIAGYLPGTLAHKAKIVSEKANLLFAGDVESEQLKEAFAVRRLAEAGELYRLGYIESAENTFAEFRTAASEVENFGNGDRPVVNLFNLQESIFEELAVDTDGWEKMAEILKSEIQGESAGSVPAISDPFSEARGYLPPIEEKSDIIIPLPIENKALTEQPKIISEPLLPKAPLVPIGEALPAPINPDRAIVPQSLPLSGNEDLKTVETLQTEPVVKTELPTPLPLADAPPKTEAETAVPLEPLIKSEPALTEPLPLAPIPAPQTIIKPIGLVLSVAKTNMLAGGTLALRAIMTYSDGLTKDVGPACAWSVSGDIGTIGNGGILQADADGGKGIVSANCSEGGAVFSAQSKEITALALTM